jgi:hypothetical protein
MTNVLTTLTPDWILPSGETIEELRQEKGLSEAGRECDRSADSSWCRWQICKQRTVFDHHSLRSH